MCCLYRAVREGTFSINSHQVCSAQRSQARVLGKPWKTLPEMERGSHCRVWERFPGTSAAVFNADTGLGFFFSQGQKAKAWALVPSISSLCEQS